MAAGSGRGQDAGARVDDDLHAVQPVAHGDDHRKGLVRQCDTGAIGRRQQGETRPTVELADSGGPVTRHVCMVGCDHRRGQGRMSRQAWTVAPTDRRVLPGIVVVMERIVVGVDESPSALTAIRWAVRECRHRGGRLSAVMAWTYLGQHHGTGDDAFRPEYGERDAAAALDEILAQVDLDGVEVERQVVCGLPVPTLLEASADADLLVVGARGMGGFRGLLLGSVSQQCAHHTTVPLAIVRHDSWVAQAGDDGEIVVGVDGSKPSQLALEWALAEAAARGTRLVAVHAHRPVLLPEAAAFGPHGDVLDLAAEGEAMVRGALTDAGADELGVAIDVRVVSGSAAAALLDAAADTASMVVVGSRGRGGFRGVLLGSVSQQVVHHAPCVAIVVPGPR